MINSNFHEVDLPSCEVEIFDYPKKVKITTISPGALKLYSAIDDSNAFEIFRDILNIVIMEPKNIAGKLMTNDVVYLLFWLRINSNIPGSDSKLTESFTCKDSKCGKDFPYKVNLEKIPVKPLKEYKEPTILTLKSFEEEDRNKLSLKLLRFDDEIALLDIGKSKPEWMKKNSLILRAAFAINTPLGLEERIKYIDTLTNLDDLAAMIDFLDVFSDWGYTFVVPDVVCPHCSKSNKMVLPFRSEIFVPELQSGGYFRRADTS